MSARTKTQEPAVEAEDLNEDNGRALVEFNTIAPAALFAKGGTRAILERIAKEARAIVATVDTAAGRATIRSNAAWVARSKAALEKAGLEYARQVKAAGVAVDAERRTAKEFLEALQVEVRAPLTALEEAERARVQGITDRLGWIVAQGDNLDGLRLEVVQARIADLSDMDMGPDWAEFLDNAIQNRANALNRLSIRAGELGRLAQAEEEARQFRAQQAEQARLDRERAQVAEAERAQAQAETERLRTQAAEAQRQAAEAQRQAAQDREAAQRAQDRAAEAEARAQATPQTVPVYHFGPEDTGQQQDAQQRPDRERAAQVHREIVADLVNAGLTEGCAKSVVTCVARGLVPRLSITY
jgi:hypothetical protein